MTCQNSGPNHAHFPVGWHLTSLDLLPGGQDLRHGSALVVFPLSFIPVLIKGSYAYCISVKVMTLIGIQCGKGHGIENEKASCDRGILPERGMNLYPGANIFIPLKVGGQWHFTRR